MCAAVMVTRLKLAERRVLLDNDRLSVLTQRLGPERAETYIMDHIEKISDRLARVEASLGKSTFDAVVPDAEAVARFSAEIGLISLGKVSRDLWLAASHNDSTACHAIWERLVRIGDVSLAKVWDLPA